MRKEAAPGLPYDDGSHTAFMNVGAADDSGLGRLAHDLVQTRAEDMYLTLGAETRNNPI